MKILSERGRQAMRISVNRELKVIQFWVSNEEKQSEDFMAEIRRIAALLPNCEKFKRIIYVSGSQSLSDLTYDLLKRNRLIPIKNQNI